jgi:aerobic-type carbon monoxide dehydrogenase small subunit (CoxS/CutS family)
MDFTLNGTPASADVRPGEHLLEVLRDRCAVTSVKDGRCPSGPTPL